MGLGGASKQPRSSSGEDLPQAVSVEYDTEDDSDGRRRFGDPSAPPEASRKAGPRRLASVAIALAAAAALVLYAGSSESERRADDARAQRDAAASETTDAAPTTTAAPFDLTALPTVPEAWLRGRSLAWVDGEELRIRHLDSGEDLEFGQTPRIQIPPLPDEVRLLGSTNRTYAIVPAALENSGLISQVYRTVRLADGVATFGFLEDRDDGGSVVSTGTLWGPSILPLAEIGAESSIVTVPGRGFVVSHPDGRSDLVSGSELRAAPSNLGRIVAASTDRLAGVSCDATGDCVGRVTDWDGLDELVVEASVLAAPVVRLSAPSGQLFSWSDGTATMIDDAGEVRTWSGGPAFNQSLVWDDDTELFFWVEQGRLLVMDPAQDRPRAHLARTVGELSLTPGADMVVLGL